MTAAHRREIAVGDRVRHFASGWTGVIASINDEEACGQGRLVTVDPVYAGGKTWKAITVTEDELEPDAAPASELLTPIGRQTMTERHSESRPLRDLPVVYVAGPYTKPDPCENTNTAIAIANAISDVCAPLVPHISHFWHTVTPRPYTFWTELDMAYLRRCDAVLRFDGESPGADAEVDEAVRRDIPVFYSEEALRAWLRTK